MNPNFLIRSKSSFFIRNYTLRLLLITPHPSNLISHFISTHNFLLVGNSLSLHPRSNSEFKRKGIERGKMGFILNQIQEDKVLCGDSLPVFKFSHLQYSNFSSS